MSTNNALEALQSAIESSFDSAKSSGGLYKNILRFQDDKEYVVRLLPYMPDVNNTMFRRTYRGWKSCKTGKYIEFTHPDTRTSQERNPIHEHSLKVSNGLRKRKLDKDHEDMKRGRDLWENESYLYNCYVIDDPVTPDNNGKVMVLNLGKTLHDKIYDHFKGGRANEFGMKIFDISEKGCNFKIRAETKGGKKKGALSRTYENSYFMMPSEIEGVSDNPEKIQEIYDSCFDLTQIFKVATPEEMERALEEHYDLDANGFRISDENGNVVSSTPSDFGDFDKLLEKPKKKEEPKKEESKKREPEPDLDDDSGDDDDDIDLDEIDKMISDMED